jgi:hypothetical protein
MLDRAPAVPRHHPGEDLLDKIVHLGRIGDPPAEEAGERLPERTGLPSQGIIGIVAPIAARHSCPWNRRRGGGRAEGKFSVHDMMDARRGEILTGDVIKVS